ncbi:MULTISPECIES: MFS transporter [Acidianus]|uniref:Major facilitator transporter n=1 Tax=Candidatus Acidianus copahuensis TaxID=1160895 RepID=A0A031LIM8_9CREN|nr:MULTISPECIES: MFS transporter [Acidianus]EZQ01992.1 major facilitator transporter [Candidatus Acidianus copahuensis]NON63645.1 MFS transporter [Acidianus sp. RZ1]
MDRVSVVTFVVVLGTMMAAIDSTIVILALPTIVQSLHSNLFTIIWVILIYLLIAAVLTTQLGRLGDNYGRARIYNIGFIIFIIGSALCGFAPTDIFLIGSRAIQAIGASMLQANSGAIIADYYPPNRRGKAYGYTSIGWNVGAILGIILGGIITTFIGWRYIFYINVPIGIAATSVGLKVIKDVNKVSKKFDLVGTTLLGTLLALITYGAASIAGSGINYVDISLIIIGIILLFPFIFLERRITSPVIDFRAFKNKVLSFSLMSSFLQSSGYLATAFILIMYLQGIRGLSPFNASVLLVPGYVIASMLGPFAGRLSDKIGARIPATIGIGMMMIAAFIYTSLTLHTPYLDIILASIIGGLGSSMFYPANNSAVMANSPKELYGSISGMLRTLANMGIVLSYVIAITIASLTVPRYVAFEVFLGTSNLIGGVAGKFLGGIHAAFFASIAILALALVFSAVRGKEQRSPIKEQVKERA